MKEIALHMLDIAENSLEAGASKVELVLELTQGGVLELKALFVAGHPDIQPLGDIEGCWMILASTHNEVDIVLRCQTPDGVFEISSDLAKQELEVEHLDESLLRTEIKRMIRNNLVDIGLTDENIDNKFLNS
jgi:hypothetical protein